MCWAPLRLPLGAPCRRCSKRPARRLLALASRDGEKGSAAAQTFGIARVYTGYADLLADPDIDAIYVPLPNQLHFEWSVRALEAGKHVLCEKPLCLTAEQVLQLCAVRDRTSLHIEEGFGFRNHPQCARLDELLAGDATGPVRAVHATLAKQFLAPLDVRNSPAAGGGALYGWLRLDFPYAHARTIACSIKLGDGGSVGSFPAEIFMFEPVNQYTLQVERFSRLLLGHDVPSWPIEDAPGTLRTIEALFASGRSGGWQALPG